MESRKEFIKQVAKTIKENHTKEKESFIFGISGKWGEGKTVFLDDLEEELKTTDSSFKIYKINPWKFASDKASFLRNFLKTLQIKAGWIKKLSNWFNCEDDLSSLYYDTSKSNIHWGILTFIILCCVCFYIYYKFIFSLEIIDLINQWKLLASIILIPIAISLFGKIIVVQKNNPAISTVDEFEKLLKKTLGEISKKGEKPIIFVDDLDRVMPEIARDVLDNLRTFFDKKEISYIVAGDHTVLERFLGKSLLPDSNPPEQLEEGRRFMKKIFNVYWRLPLPIDSELSTFLDEQFTKKDDKISKIFGEDDRKIFKDYLKKYFDKNFRQIIRFLDSVLFTFQIIKLKSEKEQGTDKYFKELLDKPLLVVRILMIQENCTPLFDNILSNYQILADLEYAVDKKNSGGIDSIITKDEKNLSSFQKNFIKSFIYEEPRFFKNSCLQVSDIRPFLFLAADASFGDSRGPSGEDFLNILNTGDPAQVKNSLISIGEEKAEKAGDAFKTRINNTPEAINKLEPLKTMMAVLQDMPPEYLTSKIFIKKLLELDYTFIDQIGQQKMEILKILLGWLDRFKEEETLPYVDKFPYKNSVDFGPIDFTKSGIFTTKIIIKWLLGYYLQNKLDSIKKMLDILPKINKQNEDTIKGEILTIQEDLINDILIDSTPTNREDRFLLIRDYTTNGKEVLRKKLLEKIHDLNVDILQWSRTKKEELFKNSEEIDFSVLERLSESVDFNELNKALSFIMNNKISNNKDIWSVLSQKHLDIIIDNFSNIINANYYDIAPDETIANQLMDKLITKIKTMSEDQQIQWLEFIKKNKWIWINLRKGDFKRRLKSFSESSNDLLKSKYEEVILTWNS